MKIENLRDILQWTQQLHLQVSQKLQACSNASEKERVKMLLSYLAKQERQIVKALKDFEAAADDKALGSWCYEYFQSQSKNDFNISGMNFDDKDTTQIISLVVSLHDKILDIYRQLLDQLETPPAVEVIRQLLELEHQEVKRIAQTSNRFNDM